jgi:hypothetical protein
MAEAMIAESHNDPWTRFMLWTVGSTIGLFLALVGALYLIDPYDTGRSPFSHDPSLRGQKEVNATASVGRNPNFTAAVIGNSTIAHIMPARLTELTGIPFAQLSVPGAQIPEQLAVIDWFMKHHIDSATALVLSINRDTWCTHNPEQTGLNPFPFWRFSRSTTEYLAGLLSVSSVEQAGRRLGLIRSAKTQSAADGFWDYEPLYAPLMADPARRREILFKRTDDQSGFGDTSLVTAQVLEKTLQSLPAEMSVVLVFPPMFTARQPQPGSPRDQAEQRCRQRFLDIVARRPNSAAVDWWQDRPEWTDPDLFIDQQHYRHPIARAMEEEIAAALKTLQKRRLVAPQGSLNAQHAPVIQ